MNQIHIGTCLPGTDAIRWIRGMKNEGFERFTLNFHMSYNGVVLEDLAVKVKEELDGTDIKIAAIGAYRNPLMFENHVEDLKKAIDAAHLFGTNVVSTFAGGLEGRPVEEAMPVFKKVFGELVSYAEDRGVRIAIENCPMGGTWEKATCNIGYSPRAWEMMFNEVNSDSLGLEWEPAHAMSQLIDPVAELKQWVGKIVHVHGKDASIDWDGIRHEGIMCGKNFMPNRTPGFGDTNWRDVFTILRHAGYEGDVCIEGFHDYVYGGDWELTSQLHALKYLKWARGGDFVPNP